jgi:abequosyltransferase
VGEQHPSGDAPRASGGPAPVLSICMATFGRGAFIGETLEALLTQADNRVEIVVVDGASPDNTPEVVTALQTRWPRLIYHREASNAGVDRDFDKAVGYARGEYCWLLSDDDIPVHDALESVLENLSDKPDLLVVNAEIRDKSLSRILKARQLDAAQDGAFGAEAQEQLFAATAGYLSFIGGVVIRRAAWLARERERYFGSLFIHMGVIFQRPALQKVKVMARPLIRIRYGNAMWSARGFEVWTRLWPDLVWAFDHFSEATRRRVIARYPARSLKILLWYRAIGAYGPAQARDLLARRPGSHHRLAGAVARLPAGAVNTALALYCAASTDQDAPMKLYDLGRAECATSLTRWLTRRSLSPETGR